MWLDSAIVQRIPIHVYWIQTGQSKDCTQDHWNDPKASYLGVEAARSQINEEISATATRAIGSVDFWERSRQIVWRLTNSSEQHAQNGSQSKALP